MPRKKNWRKSESRRAVLGEQQVLEIVSHRQNPVNMQVQSPVREQARSPASMQANASKSQKDTEKGNTQKNLQTMYHKKKMKRKNNCYMY